MRTGAEESGIEPMIAGLVDEEEEEAEEEGDGVARVYKTAEALRRFQERKGSIPRGNKDGQHSANNGVR